MAKKKNKIRQVSRGTRDDLLDNEVILHTTINAIVQLKDKPKSARAMSELLRRRRMLPTNIIYLPGYDEAYKRVVRDIKKGRNKKKKGDVRIPPPFSRMYMTDVDGDELLVLLISDAVLDNKKIKALWIARVLNLYNPHSGLTLKI